MGQRKAIRSVCWKCPACGTATFIHVDNHRLHAHTGGDGRLCPSSRAKAVDPDDFAALENLAKAAARSQKRVAKNSPPAGIPKAKRGKKRRPMLDRETVRELDQLRAEKDRAAGKRSRGYDDRMQSTSVKAVSGGAPGSARR